MSIANYYPAYDSNSCFSMGQAGRCGFECSVYLDGKCSSPEEMVSRISITSELEVHESIYGQLDLATAITLQLKEE